LDEYSLDDLQQVKKLTADWIDHYNHERFPQTLGMQTPASFLIYFWVLRLRAA
jgi:transposase InsO family protein